MIRMHFPIIEEESSYLDSAATTQKPLQVIEAIKNFYEEQNSNVNRGIYSLAERATRNYDNARKTVGHFVNAERIIFVKNATEGFNLLAYGLSKNWKKGENIVTTVIEHHSNYLPWKMLAEEKKVNFRVAGIKNEKLDVEELLSLIDSKTRIVAINYVSNGIGIRTPVKKIIKLIKEKNPEVEVVIDATQAVAHFEVDMKKLNADYLVFSGHKMYGPMGIGAVALSAKSLEKLPKFMYGGSMVSAVIPEIEYSEGVNAFEAGTPNVAGAIGLAAAIDFIKRVGFEEIKKKDKELINYAITEMNKISGIRIYGEKQVAAISFTMKNAHPHDIASIMDSEKVALRAGHHCAQPLLEALGITATARISFGLYTNKDDIDRFINGLKKVNEVFK